MPAEKNKAKSVNEIRDFYDSTYYKNTDLAVPGRHEYLLGKKLGAHKDMTVLDVACGTGAWLKVCFDLGTKVSGIDLSEMAIQACKELMPGGVFFAQQAESLPFADASFDLVTCLGSLEHFLKPESALAEMVRVAKPDAKIVILVPNSGFLTRRLGLFSGTYQVDAREEVRSLDEWSRLFGSAGLIVENRWKDLHVLSWSWIKKGRWFAIPFRFAQAIALMVWPLKWQYQVYHLCCIEK